MEKLTKEWEELKSFLPNGWEEKARESKAICRTRKVGSAEELLRVELLHFGEGLSLKETSNCGQRRRNFRHIQRSSVSPCPKERGMVEMDVRRDVGTSWDADH